MEKEASNLLEEFRHGSPEAVHAAFERLFREHQRAVYGWILRITRNPAAAEELTVESFWRIYQARSRFDPARGFEGWARRIASHAALDWLRAQRLEREDSMELCGEVSAPMEADPAVTAEIRARTALAFGRLPPKLRITATLAVIEELPQREVALALGISVAAVKVRVFRAMKEMGRIFMDLQKEKAS